MESTARDLPLQETLRRVLNFTSKAWEAAKAHAMKAVETDNRMRIWLADDAHSRGLLFRCNLGRVDLDTPIGTHVPSLRSSFEHCSGILHLHRRKSASRARDERCDVAGLLSRKGGQSGGTQVEMDAILAQHPMYDRSAVAWLQQQACQCWWRPGHPGWSIWPADSEQFIRGVVEPGDAMLTPVQVVAPPPLTPHSLYPKGLLAQPPSLQSQIERPAAFVQIHTFDLELPCFVEVAWNEFSSLSSIHAKTDARALMLAEEARQGDAGAGSARIASLGRGESNDAQPANRRQGSLSTGCQSHLREEGSVSLNQLQASFCTGTFSTPLS